MRANSDDRLERAVLVGLVLGSVGRLAVESNLDELSRLVDTAGGVEVARLVQERTARDPATVVGAGFASRVAEVCRCEGADLVVFDEDLTGSQVRNLERVIPDGVKILDRAGVILDIFAQRARTREAQTQVELAQLTYLLPRLTRRWRHLSRQAGGIGTRGVGETQLEIDRRLITRRITQLRGKLGQIEARRRRRRAGRRGVATVAIVGYTNAGKSSLFRKLTRAAVEVEDRLFATLDPRARRAVLGDGFSVVVTDTVGFIRKLPHHLVAPFRSTLEETAEADLVLHLVDGSHPAWEEHLRVGEEVLAGLGVDLNRVIVVLNKLDLAGDGVREAAARRGDLWISAATGEGLKELRALLRRRLLGGDGVAVLEVPLADAGAVERVLGLPNRLARRFGRDSLRVAVRADRKGLEDQGLGPFLTAGWETGMSGNGSRPGWSV